MNAGKDAERPVRMPTVLRAQNKRDDAFYQAFEQEFRGSRELIRSRLRVYFAFLEPLKELVERPTAVDLGCGRGEWLELLREHGYQARGVDIDEDMLTACRERNLDVKNEDAVKFLQAAPDASQMILSAFHVVEHLPFSALQNLIRQAFRVLKPGGLLFLETPNPENIKVSSLNFYLDPTHRHPLPPDLLSFLPKFYGFDRVKIVRLQERPDLSGSESVTLDEVLAGASPDYAVIAQKPCDEAVAKLFDSAFEKEFGISDRALVDRFDRQLAEYYNRVAASEARCDNLHRVIGEVAERDRRLAAADAELRRVIGEAQERDRQLAAADTALRRLSGDIEERDRQLASVDTELRRVIGEAHEREARLAAADAELRRVIGEAQEREGRLAAADAELRRVIGEAQERDRQLAVADTELRRLIGEAQEREERLAAADAELRRVIGEAQERDRQLAAADTELRRLIGEAQERDRQLASSDTELRRLIGEAQERDRQLASADIELRRLIGEAQERDRQLAAADTALCRANAEIEERDRRLTEMSGRFAVEQNLFVEQSAELDAIKRSFTWRATSPLRRFAVRCAEVLAAVRKPGNGN
jgi:SAM-dependent methyltransferase